MAAAERYTDERLNEDLRSGWPGDRNAAPYLLKLDTPERRFRAVMEAHTLVNILGFRYSQGVSDAVSALLRNIASGHEDAELYGEEFARKELEYQRESRRIAGYAR